MSKLQRFFPYIILVSALLVSMTGSYYSIYGISKIFAGHETGAIMMAISIEFGNIVSASSLKIFWKSLPNGLKYYLCFAVLTLSVVTSIGIFGFLSDGYEITANKDKIFNSKIQLVEKNKERFEVRLSDYKKEKEDIDNSISSLRKSLSTDNQYQTVDKRGNVLTQIQSTQKKGVQSELALSTSKSDDLSRKIENLNDSISVYDIKLIEIKSNSDIGSELGPLKYVSRVTGYSMDSVVKWFLILIMLVFQPLAIALILTALFAFSNKEENEVKIDVKEVVVPEEVPVKKQRKRREKKIPQQESEMEYPKTFNIGIEGLEPGEILFPKEEPNVETEKKAIIEDQVDQVDQVQVEPEPEVKPKVDKKTRKRKVVERTLTDDLAKHISAGLDKKKR